MSGIDELLSGLGFDSFTIALLAALLLGLRHATDPDHLAALTTLVVGEGANAPHGQPASAATGPTWASRACILGFSWGMGHGLTLFAVGLPVVFLGRQLPDHVLAGAEVLAGILIVVLAARLLRRWLRGHFHIRPDSELPSGSIRSPLAAFGLGVVHGVGGSAAVGILVVANASDARNAVIALAVFALGTAVAMASLSGLMGGTMAREPVRGRLGRLVPTLGVACLAFGIWYALAAAGVSPYGR